MTNKKPAPVVMIGEAVATHANQIGYSDITPYEIVRVISETTIEIRRMSVEKDPKWKPEITPGGFAGHCSNQQDQTWIYHSNPNFAVIRCRKVKPSHAGKMCTWKSAYGYHRLATEPCHYYDYNF